MLSKMLFVGVGGSGGKTLSSIRQTLDRRLRFAGWQGGFPDAWQFVWIDTISEMEPIAPFAPLPASTYLGLVPNGKDYTAIRNIAIANGNNAGPYVALETLGGWLPDRVLIDIGSGAGQSRAIGRAISAAQLRLIQNRVSEATSVLGNAATLAALQQISTLMGATPDGTGTTQAFVVGSMAGGTGSGIFMDVVEAMLSASPELRDNHRTILFAPDVFSYLADAAIKEVQPNALAAISEVMAGTWSKRMPAPMGEYFRAAGITARADKFGPARVYLLGSSNAGGVTMGNQNEVYRAAGEAIAAVATSEELQTTLLQHAETNAFLKPNMPDMTRVKVNPGPGVDPAAVPQHPLSSLGFARVSLGVERLGDFIKESLGTAGVRQLLWPKYEPVDPHNTMTPAELVSARVSVVWPQFLAMSGLNERNPANDVVDALSPLDREARLQRFAADAISTAAGSCPPKGMSPQEWASEINRFLDANLSASFVSPFRAATNEAAQAWGRGIQARITDLVATVVAEHGLLVARAVLEELIQEVKWVADEELRLEVDRAQRYQANMAGEIYNTLTSAGLTQVPPGHPIVQDAAGTIVTGLGLYADEIRYSMAIALINDVGLGLLRPLSDAVLSAQLNLLNATEARLGPNGALNTWRENAVLKSDDSTLVPSRFDPAATELLLIEPRDYPGIVREQVMASIAESQRSGWFEHARYRALLDIELADPISRKQSLIETVQEWNSQDPNTSASFGGGRPAKFRIADTPAAYEDRVATWMLDPNTALGKYLAGNIAEYVMDANPVARNARKQDFISKFRQALDKSAPLAAVNTTLAGVVHPGYSTTRSLQVSRIPFDKADEVGAELNKLLEQAGGTGGAKAASLVKFDLGAHVREISIFDVLDAASPVVFDSLMAGIGQTWNMAKGGPQTRASFWAWRRTLPLAMAIPASPELVQRWVTGWFVAYLLNQIDFDKSAEKTLGPKVSIYDRGDRKSLAFPHPMLADADQEIDFEMITGVLASAPLVLVEVNRAGTLDPMRPYWALEEYGDLGTSVGAGGLKTFQGEGGVADDTLLIQWIVRGALPESMRTPRPEIAGGATMDERKSKVLGSLDAFQNHIAEIARRTLDEQRRFDSALHVSQAYELRELLEDGISRVRARVQGVH